MSGDSYSKEPPPPSYAESQNYPQFGSVPPGQTQTQSIFTYGVTPSAPPVQSSVPTAPSSYQPQPQPQPQPIPQQTQYSSQSFAQYGTPAAGFSSYAQNYGPSPAAPIQAGYQTAMPYGAPAGSTPTGVTYNPGQGTAQSYTVQNAPVGYTTTPLAYGNTTNIMNNQRQKKIAVIVCVFVLIMVITMVIFFTMFL